MRAADIFVKQLEEEGVEYIFGLPGEENLEMLDALKSSSIKLIVTRHEQGAAFMAATYGRLTGKAGVCFATLGPGATNLVTGVAHAQLIGAPLISISGQKAIKKNWQARFQIVDIVSLMKPITQKSVQIVDPDTIPTIVREAFKIAESERPGAVHIELPEDVADSDTDAPVQRRTEVRRPFPDKAALEEAAKVISSAKRPLIMVSSGANRKRITKHLAPFVKKTGIYVVHTQMGKGALCDDSDYSLFAAGIHKHDYVHCGIEAADVIITIGYNVVEYPPYVWNKELQKKIVNIDFVDSEPDKYYNPDVDVVGDVGETLEALTKMINKKWDVSVFKETRAIVKKKIDEEAPQTYPLHPLAVVKAVRSCLDKYDIVTLDNGIYKLWFSRMYETFKPNTLLLDNALATMGAGLPSGMAAKLVNPDRRVVAVCGDGGFMMNSQEIETAIRYGLNLVILVLNDNGYGFIKWKQKDRGFKEFGLSTGNPDFVKYAEAYGAKALRVGKKDTLKDVLEKAFAMNTVVLVECPIDYSVNYSVFSEELENLVCPV